MTISSVFATPGEWVDTNTPLSQPVLDALGRRGTKGTWRYAPLPGNNPLYDISRAEQDRILVAKLQLSLVQHVRAGDPVTHLWDPAVHDGEQDARAIVAHARTVTHPEGVHLWLDLEAIVLAAGSLIATVKFATDWQHVVISEGFRAGLYHGYSVPLSAEQLYDLPGFDQYGSDAGHRAVGTRGNSFEQGPTIVVAGTKFDVDQLKPDLLGCLPRVAELLAA